VSTLSPAATPDRDHGRGGNYRDAAGPDSSGRDLGPTTDPSGPAIGLEGQLQAAMALLPPTLGGAPSQPLNLGRATRVVQPAQRHALAVPDRGGVVPDCDRPLSWCDTHHLQHWADGGPTNLTNLALLCRAHHRTVHEDGWQLTRGPNGRFRATPGQPPHQPHRRQHRPSAT